MNSSSLNINEFKDASPSGELTLDSIALLKSEKGQQIIKKAKESKLYQKLKDSKSKSK